MRGNPPRTREEPSGDRLRDAERIYFDVVGLGGDERGAALDRLCAGDAGLRSEVESLLSHAPGAEAFLEEPALGTDFRLLTGLESAPDLMTGKLVDRYRIEGKIASGGMGSVYLARRDDGEFQQQVAVKLVKRGMDSDEIVRRFRAERRTLAALDHPNIARLIDGGMTPEGQPYLVMEYVPGSPIDEYCDGRALDTHARLRLFLSVCDAVGYAHQNLVVHRDIKPGNILVTPEGVPKLLDFGIAKVLDQASPADVTIAEERRLTPEYASPEQVAGQPITTASDVYSLGVVLYELLTGHRPYQFRSRSTAELERVICGQEPLLPSTAVRRTQTRLRTNGAEEGAATPGDVSRVREGSPERLRRRLRGDLDTIVMMALRKEPSRRYASVEALATDIRRYLADLPVHARRETPAYLVGKFVKRNAAAVGVGVAVFGLVLGGLFMIKHQRDEAYAARDQAERIADFMQQVLGAADAGNANAIGTELRVRDILESAAQRAETAFPDNPRVLASVKSTIGRAYLGLGMDDKAEGHIRAALELRERTLAEGHHDLAESKIDLAHLHYKRAEYGQAEALLRAALATHQALRGRENADTARVWNDLGAVLRSSGKMEEAEAAHRRALKVRLELAAGDATKLEDVAESYNNIAAVLAARGDLDGAVAAQEEALRIRRQRLDARHPMVVQAVGNLAVMKATRARAVGDQPLLREAIALMREACELEAQVLGVDHPEHARSVSSLAAMYAAAGDLESAVTHMREAVRLHGLSTSPENLGAWSSQAQLARLLIQAGSPAEARALLEDVRGKISGDSPRAAALRAMVDEDLEAAKKAEGAMGTTELPAGR
jgi:eukaryotic-like serine/threonine-protein kinase